MDALTGEVRTAQIFVAALGASNLTYAEARWTQGLAVASEGVVEIPLA
jgi:transposase